MNIRSAALAVAVLAGTVLVESSSERTVLRAGDSPVFQPDTAAPRTPGPLLSRFLDGPLKDVQEIVFAVRGAVGSHWYENS